MYMAMLVALTLAFPSCNVEMELGNNTLEYRERTAYLCSYDWQDDWYDDYGLHHFQVLRFYTNGTGEDFIYNPQIQISAESETKRSIFRKRDKTKRSKKESAQHSKSRNKSFVMTSVSAL